MCIAKTLIGICLSGLLGAWTGVAQGAAGQSEFGSERAVPQRTILVKGAWSSASDSVAALPEQGSIAGDSYDNAYFGLSYPLFGQWTQRYSGPPPSDSGYYVLAQIEPNAPSKGSMGAHLLIAAQDLFFSLLPVSSALEQINYTKAHLAPNYRVERAPAQVRIANHSFVRFDYTAPASRLHWRVLATQVRCHVVQFIITSQDTQRIDKLADAMKSMNLLQEAGVTSGEGGGEVPICIQGYAASAQRITGENPVVTEQRFNPIPVRIVIDTAGRVKHIHFLSAFAGQRAIIVEALSSWRFKPYLVDGQAVEVETGVMFGRAPKSTASASPL